MGTLFDIDFVTTNFSVTNLGHYLGCIKNASSANLIQLKSEVRGHKKTNPQQQAFSDIPNYSTHDAILAAINHELRKRSFRYRLYTVFFPVIRFLASSFRGLEVKNSEDFGLLYTVPRRKNALHMSLGEIGSVLWRFFTEHWKFIVTSLIAIAGVLIAWLR